jgi:hypothetical protein
MKRRLGHWDSTRQEICLNRNVVLKHPWHFVRDILLHEIAHQFTDQVLHNPDPHPHGEAFQKACRQLRANPKASLPHGTNDLSTSSTANRNDRLLLRIKKLLALAESNNRFEAENAMLKAHELTAKYNIDLIANHMERREFESMIIGHPALRHRREEYSLASLLQDFYFVKGIWISAYVLDRGKMGRVLEISGTPHNILNASYVHEFVSRYILFRWDGYNKRRGLSVYRKTDFAEGVIDGFRSKLKRQRKTMERSNEELYPMVVEDPQLKSYFTHRYPHTASISRKGVRRDHKIHCDGVYWGQRLVIHRGITERKHGNRALPEK